MKIKISLCFLSALFLGVVGCNIFNPTESINIDNSDADALTYEGYMKIRSNDYTEAERFFNKAIEVDSTHSEAWYGLAKAKINIQQINAFDLLKYVNKSGGSSQLPISSMSDEVASRYQASVDSIINFLKIFITYDTTGRLDGVITYKTISDSYMLLQMFQTMLVMKKSMADIPACLNTNAETGLADCNIGDILNGLHGEKTTETLQAMHEIFATCSNNPQSMGSFAGDLLPGFSFLLSNDGKSATVSATCEAMSKATETSDDPKENEKALSTVISFSGYSMDADEDGDGCIDEEIVDGQDNDGDGEVDEDPRDQNSTYEYDEFAIARNLAHGEVGTSDLMVIKSIAPDRKYMSVDIDMNGTPADEDEWQFIFPDYRDRNANNNHRFKFTEKLTYNPMGLPFDEFMAKKREVALDYEGRLDLQYRKNVIGGCWVNYSEADFRKNLAAQEARYKE